VLGLGLQGKKYTMQQYEPPGPIGAAYIESTHPISVIMGPGGSGKTDGSAYKGPHLTTSWYPVCKDGVIRVHVTVLRDVYRDMARTALESWHNPRYLFPKNHPWTVEYTGGVDRPTTHKLKWHAKREGVRELIPVEFTAYFAAIGETNPEQFAKGFQTSMVWLNEIDLHDEAIPGLMFSRTGRYPPVDMIAPSEMDRVMGPYRKVMQTAGLKIDDDEVLLPRVLWGDCNPPDPDNWVARNLVDEPEKHPMYKLFRQPSGLSSKAENRVGKPRSAYEQDLSAMTPDKARRYVYGEIGYAKDGKPVYENEFNNDLHVSDEVLQPVQQLPLALGMDAGGSPACVIGQFMPNGQLRLLDEICADPGTGPSRFSEQVFEALMARFPRMAINEAYADPSSWYGADKIAGEMSWVDIVARALQVPIQPAQSNEPGLRQDAVRHYLSRPIDGNTPRLLLSARCKRLRGGFAAHYKLTKQASAGQTDKLAVAKNEYSHIHDALQYLCLGHRGRIGVISEAANMGRGANVTPLRGHTVVKSNINLWK
jgi:hypothetical protein